MHEQKCWCKLFQGQFVKDIFVVMTTNFFKIFKDGPNDKKKHLGLVRDMQHTITWANGGPVHWLIYITSRYVIIDLGDLACAVGAPKMSNIEFWILIPISNLIMRHSASSILWIQA